MPLLPGKIWTMIREESLKKGLISLRGRLPGVYPQIPGWTVYYLTGPNAVKQLFKLPPWISFKEISPCKENFRPGIFWGF